MKQDQAKAKAPGEGRSSKRVAVRPSEKGRWPRAVPPVMRAASHTAVWIVISVPLFMQMADGWRPTRDDAAIAIGSWQVLSPHFPLVGLVSQASPVGFRHVLFDLGPLLFWVLSVPVHIDPNQGALWGAALASGVALSVGIEAAYSTVGWPGASFVSLVVLDMNWKTRMFSHLDWNPYVGLVFLLAACAIAWRVATGGFGWWPLVVLTASIAAQCHLVYVTVAVGLVAAAPLIALVSGMRPDRFRWLLTGCGVGILCWIAPLIQQVTSSPGNLTALLHSGSRSGRAGLPFGLHALATATTLKPIWLTEFPFLSSLDLEFPRYIDSHGIQWALGSLLVLVGIAGYGRRSGRMPLAAASAVSLIVSMGLVISFASFPKANLGPSGYLANILWPAGTLVWATALWAVCAIASDVWRARSRRQARQQCHTVRTYMGAIGGAILLVLVAVASVRAVSAGIAPQRIDPRFDKAIARSVEAAVKRGPVTFEVEPSIFDSSATGFGVYVVDYWGIAYILLKDGWQPAMTYEFYGAATHLTVPRGTNWPRVVVDIHPASYSVSATHTWREGREVSRSYRLVP